MNAAWVVELVVVLLAAPNSVPAGLNRKVAQIESKPMYAHSVFGIFVADQSMGKTLIDQLGAHLASNADNQSRCTTELGNKRSKLRDCRIGMDRR